MLIQNILIYWILKNILIRKNSELQSTENAVISEDEFFSGEYHSRYCEPNGAVAVPEKNGTLTIYTVSQWPDHVKRSAASAAGLNPSKVNVVITELSSPLEGRIWFPSLIASQAAAAAVVSGKPVKLFLNEKENHKYTPRQFPFKVKFKSIISDKRKSLEVNIDIDTGCLKIVDTDLFKKTILSSALFTDLIKLKLRFG